MNTHSEKRFSCRITQAKELGGNYFLLTFIVPPEFIFEPGQYVRMFFCDENGRFERFYSIANAPNQNREVQFCIILNDSRVAPLLKNLKPGDHQCISEALGRFRIYELSRPIVLIAGGSGISPMRAFFQQLTDGFRIPPHHKLNLVYGCKESDYIPGKEEFLEYMNSVNDGTVRLWLVSEKSSDQSVAEGRVTDYLEDALLPKAHYYMCGPQPMLEAVFKKLQSLGVDRNSIFRDPF